MGKFWKSIWGFLTGTKKVETPVEPVKTEYAVAEKKITFFEDIVPPAIEPPPKKFVKKVKIDLSKKKKQLK
jgi:hypothetical protein